MYLPPQFEVSIEEIAHALKHRRGGQSMATLTSRIRNVEGSMTQLPQILETIANDLGILKEEVSKVQSRLQRVEITLGVESQPELTFSPLTIPLEAGKADILKQAFNCLASLNQVEELLYQVVQDSISFNDAENQLAELQKNSEKLADLLKADRQLEQAYKQIFHPIVFSDEKIEYFYNRLKELHELRPQIIHYFLHPPQKQTKTDPNPEE